MFSPFLVTIPQPRVFGPDIDKICVCVLIYPSMSMSPSSPRPLYIPSIPSVSQWCRVVDVVGDVAGDISSVI